MRKFGGQLVLIFGLFTSQITLAKIVIFAAASMTNAIQQVANNYQKQHPNQQFQFSFASSSVLAKQIEQGAPADLFLSANSRWMDYLSSKKIIEEDSRFILVKNNLVMIAPKNSQLNHIDLTNNQWHKYLNNHYLSLGDPAHVPAGIYAKTALINLGQWANLEHKLARTNNVRAALALVERGETPLGIVYNTDALASKKVKIVAKFPEDSHQTIEYPVAIVKGHNNDEVQAFLNYLSTQRAQKVFFEYGFISK